MNNFTLQSSYTLSSDDSYDSNNSDSDTSIDLHENSYKTNIPKGKLTWKDVKDYVLFIPDPLTNTQLCKQQYVELYGKILNYLDGSDLSSYFTFFFKPDIIDSTIWNFVDEDAREDFTEWCTEENLLPTLKEAHQGQDDIDVDELNREALEIEQKEKTDREKSIQIQKEKQKNKKNTPPPQKNKKELLEIQLSKFQKDLEKNTNTEKIHKIKNKIEKVKTKINSFI